MTWQLWLVRSIELLVVTYTVTYALANIVLMVVGFNPVREQVRGIAFEDLDMLDGNGNVPSVAVLVPAYNESLMIVEAVRALTELDYPQIEIIIANDG